MKFQGKGSMSFLWNIARKQVSFFQYAYMFCVGLDKSEDKDIESEAEKCKPTCFSHWITCFWRGSSWAVGRFLLIKGKDAWLTMSSGSASQLETGFPCQDYKAPRFPISHKSRWFNTHSDLRREKQRSLICCWWSWGINPLSKRKLSNKLDYYTKKVMEIAANDWCPHAVIP